MKELILGRRFNYLDLIFNAIGVTLITQGSIFTGIIFLVVAAFINAAIEIMFKSTLMQHDKLWKQYARMNMKVDAVKLHRLIYGSGLKEAYDIVEAYLSERKV